MARKRQFKSFKPVKTKENDIYQKSRKFLKTNVLDLVTFDKTVNVCDRCEKETPKSTIIINGENLCLTEIRIQYRVIGDRIFVKFSYDKELVSFVKTLDDAKFNEFHTKNWNVENSESNRKMLQERKDAFEL